MGIVVDSSSDHPIAGALVSAGRDRVLTDAEGRFVFTDLEAGSYVIGARKSGYLDGAYGRMRPGGAAEGLKIASDERVGDVRVRLWKHAAISGAVTDEAGEPIVRARIDVFARTSRDGKMVVSRQATGWTDDRGFYRIGSLPAGELVVSAVGPQLPVTQALGPQVFPAEFYPGAPAPSQAAPVDLNVGDDRRGVDFRLKPAQAFRVSGIAYGPDRVPLAVSLKLFVAGSDLPASAGFETASAGSDKSGLFLFQAVAAGDYVLRGTYEPPSPTTDPKAWPRPLWISVPLSIKDRDVRDLTLDMQQGFKISGRVETDAATRRPGPAAFRGFSGQIVPVDRSAWSPQTFTSDVSGRFTAGDVPPGLYFLRLAEMPQGLSLKRITMGGRDVSHGALTVTRDIADLVVTLTDRPAELAGFVRSGSGAPDSGATVFVFPAARDTWTEVGGTPLNLRAIRSSADGSYRIQELPPGDYYIAAVPDADAGNILDRTAFEALSRVATRTVIADGDKRTLDLKAVVVR